MTRKTQKKLRKLLTLVSCAVLLVCVTVVGTVAYLTSTKTVTNTFTVGNGIGITLDEAKVKVDTKGDYVADGDTRVTSNEYDLHPGITAKKDPTIHVNANTDNCWVVAKIIVSVEDETNTIANLRNLLSYDDTDLIGIEGIVNGGVLSADYTLANGKWVNENYVLTQEAVNDTNVFYVYFQKQQAAGNDLVIFDNIAIPEDYTSDEMAALAGLQIDVEAYAVQTEGFANVETAFETAFPNA